MLKGMERQMYDARGHVVNIVTRSGDVFSGKCTEFTSHLDNEPEVASITLKNPNKNGKPFVGGLIEFEEPEIKEIKRLD